MHQLQAEGPRVGRINKRRMRVFYVKVKDQTWSVLAHTREQAENTVHDSLASSCD